MRRHLLCGFLVSALAPGIASAVIVESEPNDSFALADPIVRGPAPWSDSGILNFQAAGGDLDFLRIDLAVGETISVVTVPMGQPELAEPNTYLGIFSDAGMLLAFDNDSGPGNGSALVFAPSYTGSYFIALTGWNDPDFSGDHVQFGDYALNIDIVPAPCTLAILVIGGLGRGGRRRGSLAC